VHLRKDEHKALSNITKVETGIANASQMEQESHDANSEFLAKNASIDFENKEDHRAKRGDWSPDKQSHQPFTIFDFKIKSTYYKT